MFKDRALQLRLIRQTKSTNEISEDTNDLNDVAATTVTSIKTIMFNGVKLMGAWVVLDAARQIVVNKMTK